MAPALATAVGIAVCCMGLCSGKVQRKLHKRVLTEAEANASGAYALDGSPYAYYVSKEHPHGEESPADWIVYLEGGGECGTYRDCVERIKTQGSSKGLDSTMDAAKVSDGMTSPDPQDNPDFYTFGTLFLPYLSGDDWIGTHRVACVPWGKEQNCTRPGRARGRRPLFFSGHNNFEAAIRHWYAALSKKPRSVLLSGGSAGGQGAFFHADRLAEMLPHVTVKANPQYGWFGSPTDMFQDWRSGRHTDPAKPYPSSGSPIAVPPFMYNISLFLPKRCLASLKAHESPFLCTALPRVALTVGVPLFVSTNLFDGWLTENMEGLPQGKLGSAAVEYLLNVTAPSQRKSVSKATSAKGEADNAAFVPACLTHPMDWTGKTAPVLGAHRCTHGAAVASWFFKRGTCERYLLDSESRPSALAAMPCNAGRFRKESTQPLLVV
mmetsp:Transcript_7627/g.21482  ORF Transcript_7627/g.21482 Transcript_7627/m.21482 type:complete len:436 (-) Transcript_7627:123-1430(-)